jgi:hypothetical protein
MEAILFQVCKCPQGDQRRTMMSKQKKEATPARTGTLERALRAILRGPVSGTSATSAGLLGPSMASRGMSMSNAYRKLNEREIAMTTANCRSANVAVRNNGSAVATVDNADEATGVPISMRESL